jgi:flagellar motor protein MotB
MALLLGSGCGRVVFVPSTPNPAAQQASAAAAAQTAQQQFAQQQLAQQSLAQQQAVQQQMQSLALQTQQYEVRAQTLDKDNQELESLLAQSRQQLQLLTDELAATRSQLQATTDQLLAVRNDNDQLRTQSAQLVSSAQQRAGAEIRANNSLLKNLTVKDIPGVQVRQDGDVVRVEVAGDRLFMPGSPYLQNGADNLLLTVMADLRRNYPDHIIGIEGHTDDAPTHSQQFPTHHHLSVAQALAAYNLVIERGAAPAAQLFVIGHGANHPVVSNASDAGRARNRRIELVVYPERVAMR